jgi:hypothetical protein
MRVLVACEFSGVVRDAFRSNGHDAWSCDVLSGVGDYHLCCDVLTILDEGWDLMIAHPPCTDLAVSGAHRFKVKLEADPDCQERALDFVWELMYNTIPRIAVENPVSIISTRIRKPDQIIQPYQFGHDASKKTCLWLKNLPPLEPTKYVEPRWVDGKPRWANQTDSGQNRLGPSETRAADRAITYSGIAEAMASQWGDLQ